MDIAKVLEILNNHIIKLETEIQLRDWEIERLKEKDKEWTKWNINLEH